MGTITRTVQSTSTQEVSTATYKGWNLSFTAESDATGVKRVSLQGNKAGSYVNAHLYAAERNSNVSFAQGDYDADLASAIIAEMEAMVEATTEEE